jgi:hypothetical protein
MTQHRTLVRSSVIAATASVSFIAVGSANAGLTIYTSEVDFVNDMGAIGASQLFLEDFENHDPLGSSGYAILDNPLDDNPNGPFHSGIVSGLTITTDSGGLVVNEPGPYSGLITSSVVGAFQSPSQLVMQFDEGATGVGFDLWGIETFIAGPPTDIEYLIYGTDGGLLYSGSLATPDSANGYFIGVASLDPIASIQIRGLRFGLDTTEYVDNVQSWATPAPGALALLGLAGLTGTRRRR